MEKSTITVIYSAAFFLLCFLINMGSSSITCYKCNSEYDPRCGDPFDSYSLGTVNCSLQPMLEHLPMLEPSVCRKNVQKVYGKTRVVRSCGYLEDKERDGKACMPRSGTHDVHIMYCACKGDLCNSAVQSAGIAAAFLLLGALAMAIL